MIKELSKYDFPDRKGFHDGAGYTEVPDISAANIGVLMEKLNEVIRVVNEIDRVLIGQRDYKSND